jgi:pantothenate synthetase
LRAQGFVPDYVALVAAETLRPLERLVPEQAGRLIAAARLGTVRLLDTIPLD